MAVFTLLLLAASAICTTAYPALYIQKYAGGNCMAVPMAGIGSHRGTPQADP